MQTNVLRGLSHTLAAVFSNCSEFRREWDAFRPGVDEPCIMLEGRWEGEWVSRANGHRGGLKCLLTGEQAGQCRAFFHADFSKILRVCYTVHLNVKEKGDGFEVEGEADLGNLAGGIYRYEGYATANTLTCSYRCKYDHGKFEMGRCRATREVHAGK